MKIKHSVSHQLISKRKSPGLDVMMPSYVCYLFATEQLLSRSDVKMLSSVDQIIASKRLLPRSDVKVPSSFDYSYAPKQL